MLTVREAGEIVGKILKSQHVWVFHHMGLAVNDPPGVDWGEVVTSAVVGEASAPDASSSQLIFDQYQKAYFGAAALFFLWLVVAAISAMEKPVFGQEQLSSTGFIVFTIGSYALIAYFLVLANPNGVNSLPKSLARATRRGMASEEIEGAEVTEDRPGRLGRVLTNPWVPVTLEFLLVGWLIYASGGIVNSPYGPVPIGMIIIGQNVYDVRPIVFDSEAGISGILLFAARVARQYWYPLALSVSLLLGLELLQELHPLVQKPAPPSELAFTTLSSLFVCMCATFVTRCTDRTAPQSAS